MSKIIGIDLGTTNSCVSVMEGKTPKVIESAEGMRTTPSVVAYTEKEVLVGQAAKRQSVTNPQNTLFAIKRLIGRKNSDDVVKRDREMVPYKIVAAKNGDAWVEAQGEPLAPEQVSAEILRKMKQTAEEYLGEKVTEAVVTVPAYFNDSQRKATKDAGRIAGREVKRIVNEPTAAALAYGIERKGKEGQDRKIAVYDLGGGTFHISIIETAAVDGEQQFDVLATNGDTFLGGEDFDLRLIEFLSDEFKKENGMDLRGDPLAMQRLKEAAEKAKVELSGSQQTEINLPYITADASGPKHLTLKLSRAKLELLVGELVERTLEPVRIALKDADVSPGDIDDVLLVGGQTRMPLVQKKVEEFFNREPRKDLNPDEAVAMGAAVQAAVLSGDVKDMLLLDVTPLTLGIETLGGIMTELIPKNTSIPTQKSETFSTAEDNQTAVTVHVCQGERKKATDNKSLGRFDLTDISQAPRGIPQIEVSFDIDANGILQVTAKDKNTGREQSIRITGSGGLSEEDIDKMVKDAEEHAESDRVFQELASTRNNAEMLCHSVRKSLTDIGEDFSGEDREKVEKALEQAEQTIKEEDRQAIEDACKSLSEASEPLLKIAAERAQKEQQDAAAEGDAAQSSSESEQESKGDGKDSVVDVDYQEVPDEEDVKEEDAK